MYNYVPETYPLSLSVVEIVIAISDGYNWLARLSCAESHDLAWIEQTYSKQPEAEGDWREISCETLQKIVAVNQRSKAEGNTKPDKKESRMEDPAIGGIELGNSSDE